MIENLDKKLLGELPVKREELFDIVSSWGRTDDFYIYMSIQKNQFKIILECHKKECYDLSKLDVSQIDDLSQVFKYSLFNGDISKWDVSNVENFNSIFYDSQFNGDISRWNISNGKDFCWTFAYCNFDGDISKWKFNKDVDCSDIFYLNKEFEYKYNKGKELPTNSEKFLEWLDINKNNLIFLNLTNEDKNNLNNYLDTFILDKIINK